MIRPLPPPPVAVGNPPVEADTVVVSAPGGTTGTTETVLQEAERIVGGSRRQDYGGCRGSFDKIALVWSAILGGEVTGEQVALCMIGLKLVRESHSHKRDNVVDIAGYARCIERMSDET